MGINDVGIFNSVYTTILLEPVSPLKPTRTTKPAGSPKPTRTPTKRPFQETNKYYSNVYQFCMYIFKVLLCFNSCDFSLIFNS